jgi:hypothetical protein
VNRKHHHIEAFLSLLLHQLLKFILGLILFIVEFLNGFVQLCNRFFVVVFAKNACLLFVCPLFYVWTVFKTELAIVAEVFHGVVLDADKARIISSYVTYESRRSIFRFNYLFLFQQLSIFVVAFLYNIYEPFNLKLWKSWRETLMLSKLAQGIPKSMDLESLILAILERKSLLYNLVAGQGPESIGFVLLLAEPKSSFGQVPIDHLWCLKL